MTKTWLRKYCKHQMWLIKHVELPYWRKEFDAKAVLRMEARLRQIKEVRRFLRQYPHEELCSEGIRMPNGIEVLKGALLFRDKWLERQEALGM